MSAKQKTLSNSYIFYIDERSNYLKLRKWRKRWGEKRAEGEKERWTQQTEKEQRWRLKWNARHFDLSLKVFTSTLISRFSPLALMGWWHRGWFELILIYLEKYGPFHHFFCTLKRTFHFDLNSTLGEKRPRFHLRYAIDRWFEEREWRSRPIPSICDLNEGFLALFSRPVYHFHL